MRTRKSIKKVCGHGFNDADYDVYKRTDDGVFICEFYVVWVNMLKRVFLESMKKKSPTYSGVTICDEWLSFSCFKEWMESQDYKGKDLDKDILSNGKKHYSPETCVFISKSLNSFMTDSAKTRGELKIGVSLRKDVKINKYRAFCRNPFTGKQESLGGYPTEDLAHNAWRSRKNELAKIYASQQSDDRIAEALISMYSC